MAKLKGNRIAITLIVIFSSVCILCCLCFASVAIYNETPSGEANLTRIAITKTVLAFVPSSTMSRTPTPKPTKTSTPTITNTTTPTKTKTPTKTNTPPNTNTPLPPDLLTATSVVETNIAQNAARTATQAAKNSAATGTSSAVTATADARNAVRTATQAAKNNAATGTSSAVTATADARNAARTATQAANNRAATSTSVAKTATKVAVNATATEVASYQEINWRELATYPNDHIGEKVIVKGVIFNVISKSEFQIYFSGTYEPCYISMVDQYTGIYEDVRVVVYGIVAGEVCGTNAFGAEVCQPEILGFFFSE